MISGPTEALGLGRYRRKSAEPAENASKSLQTLLLSIVK